MANIQSYIEALQSSVKGKDVLNNIVNIVNTLRDENNLIRNNISDVQRAISGLKASDKSILDIKDGLPGGWEFSDLKFDIQAYQMNGQLDDQGLPVLPSPDNIRNIVGRTGLGVRISGKNILRKASYSGQQAKNGFIFDFKDDGSVRITGEGAGSKSTWWFNYYWSTSGIKILPTNIPLKMTGGTPNVEIQVFNSVRAGDTPSGTKTQAVNNSSEPTVFTIPVNAYNIGIRLKVLKDGPVDETIYPLICPADESDEQWEEYSGDLYSYSLPQLLNPCYGGTFYLKTRFFWLTHSVIEFDGTEEGWSVYSSTNTNGTVFGIDVALPSEDPIFKEWSGTAPWQKDPSSGLCNMSPMATVFSKASANGCYWSGDGRSIRFVYGEPLGGTTVEEFKTFLSEHTLQVMGVLANGQGYAFDNIDPNLTVLCDAVKTIPENRTIICNMSGDIHGRYFAVPYPKEANS